ncbi:hypothetical protein AX15_003142 [Amanita polypyramis BW_CC]|nr:hypothetical protein AX15_003142 [Amanita polypyramis BW_CC]
MSVGGVKMSMFGRTVINLPIQLLDVPSNSRKASMSDPLTPPGSPGTQYAPLPNILSLSLPPLVEALHNGNHNGNPPSRDRVMVVCFDGTGNKFGENSNVVRFFRALRKDKRKEQIVYYQPGIGTYNKRAFITQTMNTVSTALDSAIALHLDDHVKDGYKYIIQNYHPGDKICLFGFSRGAHTARVVAGMLYKVGILPKENIQQVDFAFSIYSITGLQGYKLSQEFKKTFASSVDIEFVGVWDTVSSVGIVPQSHPYTSINYAVKVFRHALALDERRVRFRPNVWSELTPEREQELDVDLPDPDPIDNSDRNNWRYNPPNRDHADVKEVWFAGCHADVGGGSHSTRRNQSLSYIPLRWMIKECILAGTGILFDMEYLKESLDFDFQGLLKEAKDKGMNAEDLGEAYKGIEEYALKAPRHKQSEKPATNGSILEQPHSTRRHFQDIIDVIFDQLTLVWYFWWLLELIPMLFTFQDPQGNWIRRRRRNFGRGRYIPFYKDKVFVHKTVRERMEKRMKDEPVYVPRASNWKDVEDSPMLEYVD